MRCITILFFLPHDDMIQYFDILVELAAILISYLSIVIFFTLLSSFRLHYEASPLPYHTTFQNNDASKVSRLSQGACQDGDVCGKRKCRHVIN